MYVCMYIYIYIYIHVCVDFITLGIAINKKAIFTEAVL